ncbi:SpoIIE family protein phosphatase [Roseiconus nitratireducens]|uniref:SpoIIE family protein phosphatase n=1 Tax=Roseiconus nitratireducens TaxID=2605748 RepID=UPI001375EE25|nr:SpoIIE family protein phosphatase [Roseiconus nitratireducens]
MTTPPVPNYLRVHRGDDRSLARSSQPSSKEQFWNAFSAATGWRIDDQHGGDQIDVLPTVDLDLMGDQPGPSHPPVVRANAAELAKLASSMVAEIDQLQSVIRRQEVELAAHATAAIGFQPSQRGAQAVQETLQLAVESIGFDAAAIYMLDDQTQYLNLRAMTGLPADRLRAQPRSLRGSRADLEALVQDVVLIDDLTGPAAATWCAPEPAGAAVCAALYKGDLPIGTLWLFRDKPIPLGESVASVAKMAAAQITLHLSEAVSARHETSRRQALEAVRDVAAWQFTSLPVGIQLAEGWSVDGMIESHNDWAVGWHAWDVLPDGSLMIALAQAEDCTASGAMVAAIARAALTAHCGYRHSLPQLMQRTNDTLWQTNTAEQLLGMLYARLDPDTGEGEVVSAGQLGGLVASKYGYRPLIGSGTTPLASAMDAEFFHSTFHLGSGETLLAYGPGLAADGIGQDLLGCCLKKAAGGSDSPLAVVRREMAAFPTRNERGLVALTRE